MPEALNADFWDYLEQLVTQSEIIIDRPKGSQHPVWENVTYPLDYGYLAGTVSSDGAGIDIWVGESGEQDIVAVICTIDLLKRDTELKLLLGCTEAEMSTVSGFLNDGDMRCLLVRRPA